MRIEGAYFVDHVRTLKRICTGTYDNFVRSYIVYVWVPTTQIGDYYSVEHHKREKKNILNSGRIMRIIANMIHEIIILFQID